MGERDRRAFLSAWTRGAWRGRPCLCCDPTANASLLKPRPLPLPSGKLVIKDHEEPIVLRARHVLIDDGGELHAGSALCPYQGNFSIVLYGRWAPASGDQVLLSALAGGGFPEGRGQQDDKAPVPGGIILRDGPRQPRAGQMAVTGERRTGSLGVCFVSYKSPCSPSILSWLREPLGKLIQSVTMDKGRKTSVLASGCGLSSSS